MLCFLLLFRLSKKSPPTAVSDTKPVNLYPVYFSKFSAGRTMVSSYIK